LPDRKSKTLTVFVPTGHITDSDIAAGLESGATFTVAYPDSFTASARGVRQGGRALSKFYEQFTKDEWWTPDSTKTIATDLAGAAWERFQYLQDQAGALTDSQLAELKFLQSIFALEALSDDLVFRTDGDAYFDSRFQQYFLTENERDQAREKAFRNLQVEPGENLPADDGTILINNQQTALTLLYKQLNDYFIFGDYIVGGDSGRPLTNGYFDCKDTDESKQEGSLLIDFPAPFNPKKTLTRNSAHDMHMYYLKSDVYSYLVPDVKLYKVTYEGKRVELSARDVLQATVGAGGATDEIGENFPNFADEIGTFGVRYGIKDVIPFEMPLAVEDQYFNPDSSYPLKTGLGALTTRSGQIGVKSFNWRYLGTNRFTADKDIEAELVLRMDGIEALFAERVDRDGRPYRMSDLLILADDYKRTQSDDIQEPGRAQQFEKLGPSDSYEYREESLKSL